MKFFKIIIWNVEKILSDILPISVKYYIEQLAYLFLIWKDF